MKKLKLGLIAIAMITIFASCEDMFRGAVLEVELPEHESELAPYAFLRDTDSVLTVMVGKSVGVLDTANSDVVYNATVELYKNGTLAHTLTYTNDVRGYQVDLGQAFSPTAGDEYELRVSAPGYETTSSIQTIPTPVAADSVQFIPNGGVDQFGDAVDIINITFTDPAGSANFYEFGGYQNVKYTDPFDTTYTYEYQNPFYFESNDPNFKDGALSDTNFDGQEYTIRLETYSSFWGGSSDDYEVTGQINFSSTTPEYAKFISSLNAYWNAQDNPFAEPVILYSNMSGGTGAFGIFVTDIYEF